uniref:Regulatory protein zeste n=1 Tax=Lygus hesperus TaxID=30085 RepID=A0A0A9XQ61_LYGHE
MGEKRKRFEARETDYLRKLVMEKRNIVENKQSDAVTNSAKKAAWEEIAKKFNEEPAHTKRTVYQLMKCWDNIKTKKKKELAVMKRARMSTDGKHPSTSPSTEEGIKMESLVTDVTDHWSVDSGTVQMAGFGTHSIFMTSGPDGSLVEGGTDVDDEPELPVASQTPTPDEPSTSSGKKKAPCTQAVAAEIEERARQNATRLEQAAELHNLRLAELQTRLAIAQEELKRAQLETEHKQQLWRMEEMAFREKMGWEEK